MSKQQSLPPRPIATAIICFCLVTSPARADTGQTVAATFYPLLMHGELVGCQVGFSVLRQDDEFSQGQMIRSNGLLVVYGPRANTMGAMLRLGVTAAANNFQAPERAFLMAGYRSNRDEAGQAFQSESPGFASFPFALGEVTIEAIVRLATNGTVDVAYGMPRTNVDGIIRIDLRDNPEVLQQWGACLTIALRE